MGEELLYNLPTGWRRERIGNLVLKAKQRDPRKTPDERFEYVDVSSVSNESFRITESSSLKGKDAPSRARKEIREGDVLFATVRPTLKRVALVPKKLDGQIASTGYCVLRSDRSKVDPYYLYSFLLTDAFITRMAGLERGAGYPAVRESDVFRSELSLAPRIEQQRIAQVLSTVQTAITQQEELISTTTELKQTLMQKLFTEGLRGEAQKETEIGLVPESWDLVPIGELFHTQLGKMLSPKARTGNNPKPYLRNKNVQWDGIDTDDLHFMDFDEREMQKFRLEPGDLLVCEGGEVGRTALWKGELKECYYQKALHRMRPKDGRIRPAFMAYWMRFAFELHNVYDVTGTRTTIAHLPEIKLVPLPVPLPSVAEQDSILEAIECIDRKREQTKLKQSTLEDLFRTLLHELMTGKVRVNSGIINVHA